MGNVLDGAVLDCSRRARFGSNSTLKRPIRFPGYTFLRQKGPFVRPSRTLMGKKATGILHESCPWILSMALVKGNPLKVFIFYNFNTSQKFLRRGEQSHLQLRYHSADSELNRLFVEWKTVCLQKSSCRIFSSLPLWCSAGLGRPRLTSFLSRANP